MITGEFLDLMPHRLTVRDYQGRDYYGNESYEPASQARTYRCLVDTKVTVNQTNVAETHTVSLTAYTHSIPEGKTTPVNIREDSLIEIIEPGNYSVRPIVSIARHFDRDGTLHNLEITFS